MNLTLRKKEQANPIAMRQGDLVRLRDEMDRTFGRFLSDPFGLAPQSMIESRLLRTDGWLPAIDVSETDTEVTIRAEAPGIPASDLDISVSGNSIAIAGQKEDLCEDQHENYCHCERRFGSFRRVIDLPQTVNLDKVTAESENGIVTIHIPKKPDAKARQIEVKPANKRVAVTS